MNSHSISLYDYKRTKWKCDMHDESNLAMFIIDLPVISIKFEIQKNT